MTPASKALTASDLTRRDLDMGFAQLGYHFVVERDGNVVLGRPLNTASVHDPKGDMRRCVSVCLIGGDERGVPTDNFTPAQRASVRRIIDAVNLPTVIRTPAIAAVWAD